MLSSVAQRTVPCGLCPVLVRRTALAALVVVRLVVVPLPPRSPRRRWRVVAWADILLDVVGGVESALREGCPRTMTGVSQYWPRINIGDDAWGESSIMTGVC